MMLVRNEAARQTFLLRRPATLQPSKHRATPRSSIPLIPFTEIPNATHYKLHACRGDVLKRWACGI